jgi:hypothetical protein
MNQTVLKQSAEDFEALLNKYAVSAREVRALREAVIDLINNACDGKNIQPLEWKEIYFDEGFLREDYNLKSAYSGLKVEFTGGESALVDAL